MNHAVFSLAEHERISTVSCQVNGDAWRSGAARLRGREFDRIEKGLHLDLTEHGSDKFPVHRGRFSTFIALAYLRALSVKWIREMIERQLDIYEDSMGMQPDHVDGHLHVHQFPVIREELVNILSRRYSFSLPWLRTSAMPGRSLSRSLQDPSRRSKEFIIDSLGSSAIASLADRNGFKRSKRLLGVYGFESSKLEYDQLLRQWIAECSTGDVLMCHPIVKAAPRTPREEIRHREFVALFSNEFGDLLREQSVSITQFKSNVAASSFAS